MKKITNSDISKDIWAVVYGYPGTRKTTFAISQSKHEEITVFNFDKPAGQEYEREELVDTNNIYYKRYLFDKREDLVPDPKWTKQQREIAEMEYKNQIIDECLPVLAEFMEDLKNATTKTLVIDGALDLDILVKQAYFGKDNQIIGTGYTTINSAYRRMFTYVQGKNLIVLSHEKARYETVFDSKTGKKVDRATGELIPAANKKIFEYANIGLWLYKNDKNEYFGKITKSTNQGDLLDTEWPDPTFNFIKTLYGG